MNKIYDNFICNLLDASAAVGKSLVGACTLFVEGVTQARVVFCEEIKVGEVL